MLLLFSRFFEVYPYVVITFNVFMGTPQKTSKTNLFATNMSYRLPTFKVISGMTIYHHCGRVECILLPQNNVLCVAFLDLRFLQK